MEKLKNVTFIDPLSLLGKCMYIYFKDGTNLFFKVMACGPQWLEGHDAEQMNMVIEFKDIDYILGGGISG